LEPYQEQGQLLDPILKDIIGPVSARIQSIIRSWNDKQFKDKEIQSFPFQILKDPVQQVQLHRSCQVIYMLCKVRGYKAIVKLLPHEVVDFEPTLHLLQSQDRDECGSWEIR